MGSSSSSETADSIETDKTENFGLLNISNDIGGEFNALEIITFILVVMAAIIFLKMFCARRRKKRMDEMQKRLQGISLPEYQLPDYPPPATHCACPGSKSPNYGRCPTAVPRESNQQLGEV